MTLSQGTAVAWLKDYITEYLAIRESEGTRTEPRTPGQYLCRYCEKGCYRETPGEDRCPYCNEPAQWLPPAGTAYVDKPDRYRVEGPLSPMQYTLILTVCPACYALAQRGSPLLCVAHYEE